MKTFGETIRELRVAQDFGLRETAVKVGISPTYLSRIERGKESPPRPEIIKAIAKVLASDPDVLFRLSSSTDPDIIDYLHEQPEAMQLIRYLKEKMFEPDELKQLIKFAKDIKLSSHNEQNLFKFSPASQSEHIVFGAQRPGYPSKSVGMNDVRNWISFIKKKGIKRICCLLPQKQLNYYEQDLIDVYHREFGNANVCWIPIDDYHLCDKTTLEEKILTFLKESDLKKQKVLVHCSGGSGRTGFILAAWLIFRHGFSIEEALSTIVEMGRNPHEAVSSGHASEKELYKLLNACQPI